MALQFSTTLRTNMVNQIQATAGSSGVTLKIYTGSEPANCAASETGALLASIVVPATFLTAANGGVSIANGPWTGTASATGVAGHFRLIDASANVVAQGDCASDLVLQNNNIAVNQAVLINGFSVTQGNG